MSTFLGHRLSLKPSLNHYPPSRMNTRPVPDSLSTEPFSIPYITLILGLDRTLLLSLDLEQILTFSYNEFSPQLQTEP